MGCKRSEVEQFTITSISPLPFQRIDNIMFKSSVLEWERSRRRGKQITSADGDISKTLVGALDTLLAKSRGLADCEFPTAPYG
jgi:hypothetical protein